MPGGDRTGPAGMGPMTGRAAGYCAGYGAPGYMNPGPRRGYGMGWGGGWGRGRGYRGRFYAAGRPGWAGYGYPPEWGAPPTDGRYSPQMTTEQEAEFLRNQAKVLSDQLEALSKRLAELEEEA